jgi:cytochrome c peroxidase
MRADAGFLAAQLRADAPLSALYAGSFGRAPPADDQALMLDLARALAAYQETLVSPRTPFDRFRDALALGEERSAGYPAAAQRGLRLFIGQAQCVACHAGPAFSDGALHGRFRTPPLRELAATAPYLHDGRLANLCDTLAPHAPLPTASAAAPALSLDQRRDLVAFLLSLGAQGIPAHAERSSFDCR